MPLLITITNTGKTVQIMHLFVLSKAEQVFKEMHDFINEFIPNQIKAIAELTILLRCGDFRL